MTAQILKQKVIAIYTKYKHLLSFNLFDLELRERELVDDHLLHLLRKIT